LTNEQKRHMLVLDTAYTYDFLTQRKLTRFVTSKDCNGYFDHVWTVHAVASLFYPTSSGLRFGRPVVRELIEGHTHIEGKIGRFENLSWFPLLNFIFAQIDLIWFLLKIIKKNHITIVRAEDFLFNGILGLIISRLKRLHFVIGVWANAEAIRKDTNKTLSPRLKWMWLEKMIEGFILRRADLVCCGTEFYRSFALNHGVSKKSTVVSRFGAYIEASHFLAPTQRETGYSELAKLGVTDENVVMLISRLEKLKRVDHLVKVLSCLKNRELNVKAMFVGDGFMREELVALSKELGVYDQIVFCGNRDQDWLLRVIPCAAVIVSPSTGRALTEAALGAVPIVAYDTDWQNEIIEHGITGELVPDLDYSAMADSVEKVLKNDSYASMIGANVRARALSMMEPQNINDQVINAYENLFFPIDTNS
jgi:glycosyltransferase involved in cell wall biosynthesis